MDKLELCNRIRLDIRDTSAREFPIDAFPKKMQALLLDLEHQEGYVMEYAMSALLSAAATAIGNSCQIRIKGTWQTSPMLYVILVGRPGTGKTPPLEFAYRPIVERDEEYFRLYLEKKRRYEQETERYRAGSKSVKKGSEGESDITGGSLQPPVLRNIIVSDTTAEALWRAHAGNPRGIVIKVDEVMGFFNTLNRYNNTQMLEQLLSAFSSQVIKVSRCNEESSCYIPHPCVNLIGTMQTHRVPEFEKLGLRVSGFLDRMLFVMSRNESIPMWKWEDEAASVDCSYRSMTTWKDIIDKLLDLPYGADNYSPQDKTSPMGDVSCFILKFSKEAGKLFYEWHNRVVTQMNNCRSDQEQDSRRMKAFLITARMALVIQMLRWACDESHKQYVDATSIEAAIRLYEFYEQSYSIIRQSLMTGSIEPQKKEWLDELPWTFTTAQSIEAGKVVGLAERTVKQLLSNFSSQGILKKLRRGEYEKTDAFGKGTMMEKVQRNSPDALCTSCTSTLTGDETVLKKDEGKCEVQQVRSAGSANSPFATDFEQNNETL